MTFDNHHRSCRAAPRRRTSPAARAFSLALGAAALVAADRAHAAPPPISMPITSDQTGAAANEGPFDFLKDWKRNAGLLGDMSRVVRGGGSTTTG
jgi:hypothetical protein